MMCRKWNNEFQRAAAIDYVRNAMFEGDFTDLSITEYVVSVRHVISHPSFPGGVIFRACPDYPRTWIVDMAGHVPARPRMEINLQKIAGDKVCRFVVAYNVQDYPAAEKMRCWLSEQGFFLRADGSYVLSMAAYRVRLALKDTAPHRGTERSD